jgi:hypothetical protein
MPTEPSATPPAAAPNPTWVFTAGTTKITITTDAAYLATVNSLKAVAEKANNPAAMKHFSISALLALLTELEASTVTAVGTL